MPESIKEKYLEAQFIWLEENVGEKEPAFWEVNFAPPAAMVELTRSRIAKAIHNHETVDAETAAITLLHLIRTRLSDIRINRMWPEVARVLQTHEFPLKGNPCGTFFREVLNKYTNRTIPQIHNRFVAYCLDQTAVGPDRTEVVLGFFEYLLKQILERDQRLPPALEAYQICQRYIDRSGNREKVEVYRLQLERTGQTIVSLVRELRSGEVFHEIGFWDWEALRAWWKQTSGEDLNRLTAESREALGSIVDRIGNTLTYSSLKTFARQNKSNLAIHGPEGKVRAGADLDSIALGPVQITFGKAERILQLKDEFGITSKDIASTKDGCWHDFRSHAVFAWQQESFEVLNGRGSAVSKPFYIGDTPATAELKGYYYSTRSDSVELPKVSNSTFANKLTAKFSLATQMKLAESGFSFHIHGLNSKHSDLTNFHLVVDDHVVATGALKNGWCRIEVAIPVSGKEALFLNDAAGDLIKTFSVSGPDSAFLAVDGVIQKHQAISIKEDFAESAQFGSGIILGVRSKDNVLSNHASIKKLRTPAAFRGWAFYRVVPEPKTNASVSCGPHRWELLSKPVLTLLNQQSRKIVDGVEIQGYRNTAVFGHEEPIVLQFATPGSEIQNGTQLLLKTGAVSIRFNTATLRESQTENGEFDLMKLIRGSGREIPFGHFSITVFSRGIGYSEPISIFRCCENIRTSAVRYSEIPRAECCGTNYHKTVMAVDAALSDGFSKSWLPGQDDGLVCFSWATKVARIELIHHESVVDDAGEIELDSVDAYRFRNVSESVNVEVESNGQQFNLEQGDQLPLTDILDNVTPDVISTKLRIVAKHRELEIQSWCIDTNPTNFSGTARWNLGQPGTLEFRVEFDGFTADLSARLVDLNGIQFGSVETPNINRTGGLHHTFSGECSIPDETLSLLNSADPGVINFQIEGRKMFQLHIPSRNFVSQGSSDAKTQIGNLVKALGEQPSLDDLRMKKVVEILVDYFASHNCQSPFPNLSGIAKRFESQGSNENRTHAIECIRALNRIANDSIEQVFEIPWKKESPLRLMMISLFTVYHGRLHKRGLSDPRLTLELENALVCQANGVGSTSEQNWARCLLEFLNSGFGSKEPTSSASIPADQQLIRFDAKLNEFLRK